MEEKIKDIYNCTRLNGNDSLLIWYNQVIEKTVAELTVADVARCIRQELFVEKAYEVMLAYLLHNPYAGDVYEGELIEKASEVDKTIIIRHKTTLCEIIEKAKIFIDEYDWLCDEDKDEFIEAVHKLDGMLYQ